MAYDPNFASAVRAAAIVVATANPSRVATASPIGIETLYAAGPDGSHIDDITIIPAVSTTNGMIRFWLHDGSMHIVFKEFPIAAASLSPLIAPTATTMVNLGLNLQAGWSLKVSNNNAEAISVIVTRAGDF